MYSKNLYYPLNFLHCEKMQFNHDFDYYLTTDVYILHCQNVGMCNKTYLYFNKLLIVKLFHIVNDNLQYG